MKAPLMAILWTGLIVNSSLCYSAVPVNDDGHSTSQRDIASEQPENNFRRPGIGADPVEVEDISVIRRAIIPYRPLLSLIPGGNLASRTVAAINNIEIDPQTIQNILDKGKELQAAQELKVKKEEEKEEIKAEISEESEFELSEEQIELIASARKLIVKAAEKEDRQKTREILKTLKLAQSTTLKLVKEDEKKLAELAGVIASEFKSNEDMIMLAELLKKIEISEEEVAEDETDREKARREIVRRYYPRKQYKGFQDQYYDTVACIDHRVQTLSDIVKSTVETQNQIMQLMMGSIQNPYASALRMGGVFGQSMMGQDPVSALLQAAPGIYGSQSLIPGMMNAGGNITINNYYGTQPSFFGQTQSHDPLNVGNGIYNFDSVSEYLNTLTPNQLMNFPAVNSQVRSGISDTFNLRSPGSRQMFNALPSSGAYFSMPGSAMPLGQ